MRPQHRRRRTRRKGDQLSTDPPGTAPASTLQATALLDAALAFVTAGYSVVPTQPDGTKRPSGYWKTYQTRRADPGQVAAWLAGNTHDGIGLVCGAVSGNLELLEVEGRGVAEGTVQALAAALDAHDLSGLWQRLNTGYLEITPGQGLHWLYRVDGPARPNLKLARRPATPDELAAAPDDRVKVLIETRGEGGYVVVAPSNGRTHGTGRAWTLAAGGVDTIPVLTVDERDALHAVAATLDQMPPPPEPARPTTGERTGDSGLRPGDDYNQRATWTGILEPAGWTLVTRIGSGYGWRRPGKDRGISATTGTRGTGPDDRLYVFSSSTGFDTEIPYTKFGAYALLEHGGDHAAAARALRRAGYGAQTPAPDPVLRLVHPAPGTAPAAGAASTNGNTALAPDATTGRADDLLDAGLTDVGNAQLLVAEHADIIRYVPERGRWLSWTGHRWAWDDAGRIVELAKQAILSLDITDTEIRKHQARSLSRRAIEAMVALARSDQAVVTPLARLDADAGSLCTPGGIVDLHTGQMSPARPEDLHTRSTRVTPDPDCPTPRWNRFLADTFGDDADLTGFVQRVAGYSASGSVTHHILPFLHGPGGNGKSVFLDVLRILLGDYAGSAPAKFLMAGVQQHETEVARLAGLRLVICSEVNQEDRFDEAKVKLLTGGDALTARFMREDHFTFEPTHHLWLMGNHQPKVSSGGEAFWRRLRLVDFKYTVPAEKKIEGLAHILANDEGPGILAWIVAGAIASQKGLNEPASVIAATRLYADEEDALARFIADRIHVGGGRSVKLDTSVLRREYEDWCRDEGDKPLSPQVLGRELRTRFGVEQVRSHGKRFYAGMALVADDDAGDSTDQHWSDR